MIFEGESLVLVRVLAGMVDEMLANKVQDGAAPGSDHATDYDDMAVLAPSLSQSSFIVRQDISVSVVDEIMMKPCLCPQA